MVHVQQALEFLDRFRVIVHAQVYVAVVEGRVTALLPHHQQRGRLLSARVAAGRLSCQQRRHEPIGQGRPGARLERRGHGIHDFLSREDVPLRGVVRSGPSSGPRVALPPRPRGRLALCVHKAHLAAVGEGIALHQDVERLGRGEAHLQQVQPARPERRVRERLARDGADSRLRPGHHGPDGEELRLDRHAPLAGAGVVRDDAERGDVLTGPVEGRGGEEQDDGG